MTCEPRRKSDERFYLFEPIAAGLGGAARCRLLACEGLEAGAEVERERAEASAQLRVENEKTIWRVMNGGKQSTGKMGGEDGHVADGKEWGV